MNPEDEIIIKQIRANIQHSIICHVTDLKRSGILPKNSSERDSAIRILFEEVVKRVLDNDLKL